MANDEMALWVQRVDVHALYIQDTGFCNLGDTKKSLTVIES